MTIRNVLPLTKQKILCMVLFYMLDLNNYLILRHFSVYVSVLNSSNVCGI